MATSMTRVAARDASLADTLCRLCREMPLGRRVQYMRVLNALADKFGIPAEEMYNEFLQLHWEGPTRYSAGRLDKWARL